VLATALPALLPLVDKTEPYPAPGPQDFRFGVLYHLTVGGHDLVVINKTTLLVAFAGLLACGIFLVGFRKPQLVPRGAQNVAESLYDFVDQQIAREVIGKEGYKYAPYLTLLFVFVLINNLFGVLPVAQFPTNSRIAFPLILAVISWIMFNLVGIRKHGAGAYFHEMAAPAPTAPLPIKMILAPIEILSTLIVRPFTLAVRLFANMFAGHLLILVFTLGVTYNLPRGPIQVGVGAVSFVVTAALTVFELAIEAIQAYIFTILTAAYIAGAMEH